jgi:hypothetical protein
MVEFVVDYKFILIEFVIYFTVHEIKKCESLPILLNKCMHVLNVGHIISYSGCCVFFPSFSVHISSWRRSVGPIM